MKHFLLLILIIFVWGQLSSAQKVKSAVSDSILVVNTERVKNVVYLELLGNSVGYSFNYEHRLNNNLWGRAGFSYFPGPFVEFTSLPVGISRLFGKDSKFFELGLVVTPVYSEVDLFFDFEDGDKEFGVVLSPTIGYRYQPRKQDLFFKIAFTPLLTTFETKFLPSGGLSIGYSFQKYEAFELRLKDINAELNVELPSCGDIVRDGLIQLTV